MLETLLILVPLMALAAASPGPDVLFILTKSMGQDRMAGVVAACGIACGLVIHVGAVVFGLSSLFLVAPYLLTVIKWLGAAYLLYLAYGILMSKGGAVDLAPNARRNYLKIFRQGFLTNLLNPKAIIFFTAIIPQFVDVADLAAHPLETIFIPVSMVVTAFSVHLTMALCASQAARFIVVKQESLWLKIQKYLLAGLFGLFAVKLATSE